MRIGREFDWSFGGADVLINFGPLVVGDLVDRIVFAWRENSTTLGVFRLAMSDRLCSSVADMEAEGLVTDVMVAPSVGMGSGPVYLDFPLWLRVDENARYLVFQTAGQVAGSLKGAVWLSIRPRGRA